MTAPSDFEQLTLELINRYRMDPGGEYARLVGVDSAIDSSASFFGVDLASLAAQLAADSAVAPLAWNDALSRSSHSHSQLMIDRDEQQHNFPGELGLRDRFNDAGYTPWSGIAENIFAFSRGALFGHAGFVIDWGYDDSDWIDNGNGTLSLRANWRTNGDGIQDPAGHRIAIMNENYHEIGIGVIEETNPNTSVGQYVTTQHFGGPSSYQAQFLGVVIRDNDGDAFYDIGEGLNGVTVHLTGASGTYTTTSWASGGWQIQVPAGTYTITFSGGGLAAPIVKSAVLGAENVKVDAIEDPNAISVIDGDNAANVLWGTRASDTINALDGNDLLIGDLGGDVLYGGDGIDRIFGNDGADSIYGGDDNDKLEGNHGADLLDGGNGARDLAEYFYATEGVTVNLANNALNAGADAAGDTLVNIEDVAGGRHDDVITGDAGGNALFGRLGNDTLDGGASRDWMDGSDGDDRLIFRDTDAGIGGRGADVFEFFSGGYQVVGIFNASEGDRLDVSNLGFTTKQDFLDTASDVFGLHTRFEIGGIHYIQLNFTNIADIGLDQIILT